jgi:hypothetical protein
MENSSNRQNNNLGKDNYVKEDAYIRAKKRVDSIKGFYWHLAVYVVVNIFIVTIIVSNSHVKLFSLSALSTPLFWGIGLLFHFLGVFGSSILFGSGWEKRKIKEFMDKDLQNWEE